jgi:hypothetical protein
MLHQLEFKLQVEMQYKKAIDQMSKLYQADGDKKSRQDAEAKRVESERKVQLLQSALRRYKNLHILDDVQEEEEQNSKAFYPIFLIVNSNMLLLPDVIGPDGERKENIRSKPLSGILRITLKSASELEHTPLAASRYFSSSRSSSKSPLETHVSLKVEGTQLARSHPTRTDRWNEDFEITVDKANEVEIVVYDKPQGEKEERAVPIGLLWIRISDVVEALRRQKVEMEVGAQGGWVTAQAIPGSSQGSPGLMPGSAGGDGDMTFGGRMGAGAPMGGLPPLMTQGSQGLGQEGIDAWFAVEPAGAINLNVNFSALPLPS